MLKKKAYIKKERKMNKVELIEEIVNGVKNIFKKDVETIVDAFICTVKDTLKSGEEVKYIGLDLFYQKQKKLIKM